MWISAFIKPRLSPVLATTHGSLKKYGCSWNEGGKGFIIILFCGKGGAGSKEKSHSVEAALQSLLLDVKETQALRDFKRLQILWPLIKSGMSKSGMAAHFGNPKTLGAEAWRLRVYNQPRLQSGSPSQQQQQHRENSRATHLPPWIWNYFKGLRHKWLTLS